jgi:hypothetical protein
MGFHFRKRNKDGLNVSLSSRGLRISKTIKMGGVTFNLGQYFGGTSAGKTDLHTRVNAGNGLMYTKHKTLRSSHNNQKKTNDSLDDYFSTPRTSSNTSYSGYVPVPSDPQDKPEVINAFLLFFILCGLIALPYVMFWNLDNIKWIFDLFGGGLLTKLVWTASITAAFLSPVILVSVDWDYLKTKEYDFLGDIIKIPLFINLFFGVALGLTWIYTLIEGIYTWYVQP